MTLLTGWSNPPLQEFYPTVLGNLEAIPHLFLWARSFPFLAAIPQDTDLNKVGIIHSSVSDVDKSLNCDFISTVISGNKILILTPDGEVFSRQFSMTSESFTPEIKNDNCEAVQLIAYGDPLKYIILCRAFLTLFEVQNDIKLTWKLMDANDSLRGGLVVKAGKDAVETLFFWTTKKVCFVVLNIHSSLLPDETQCKRLSDGELVTYAVVYESSISNRVFFSTNKGSVFYYYLETQWFFPFGETKTSSIVNLILGYSYTTDETRDAISDVIIALDANGDTSVSNIVTSAMSLSISFPIVDEITTALAYTNFYSKEEKKTFPALILGGHKGNVALVSIDPEIKFSIILGEKIQSEDRITAIVIFKVPIPNVSSNEPKTSLKIAVTDSFGAVRVFTFTEDKDEEDPIRLATIIKSPIKIGQEIANKVGNLVESLVTPTNLALETAMTMIRNFANPNMRQGACDTRELGVSSFVDKCCANPTTCPEDYVNFNDVRTVLQSSINSHKIGSENENLMVLMGNTLPSVFTLKMLIDQNLPIMVGFVTQENEYLWGIISGYQFISSEFDVELKIVLPITDSGGFNQDSIGVPIRNQPHRKNVLWITFNDLIYKRFRVIVSYTFRR
jgi:hypothetical protein